MKTSRKTITILISPWLATLALGIWIGRAVDSPASGQQAEDRRN